MSDNKTTVESTVKTKKGFHPLKVLAMFMAVVLAIVLLSPFVTYSVGYNEYGRVTRFQKLVVNEYEMGLHFKTPIDHVQIIKSYIHVYDVPASIVTTKDLLKVEVDMIAYWNVEDPVKFANSLHSSVADAEQRIDAAVYSSVKNTFGTKNRDEIISTDIESIQRIAKQASEEVQISMEDYGINVIIYLKKTDPTEENFKSIYERMIADRNRKAEEYKSEGEVKANSIRNEASQYRIETIAKANAYAEKRQGEADAEYTRIVSQIYDTPEEADFYSKVRELDTLKESLVNSEDTTIFLDENSVVVQILQGSRLG